jgi:hypothetical protein
VVGDRPGERRAGKGAGEVNFVPGGDEVLYPVDGGGRASVGDEKKFEFHV